VSFNYFLSSFHISVASITAFNYAKRNADWHSRGSAIGCHMHYRPWPNNAERCKEKDSVISYRKSPESIACVLSRYGTIYRRIRTGAREFFCSTMSIRRYSAASAGIFAR